MINILLVAFNLGTIGHVLIGIIIGIILSIIFILIKNYFKRNEKFKPNLNQLLINNSNTMNKVKEYKTNELVGLIDDSLQQVRSSFANKKLDTETKMMIPVPAKATETSTATSTNNTPTVSDKKSMLSFQDVKSDESYTSTNKLDRKKDQKSRSKIKKKKRKEARKERKEKK